VQDGGAHYAGVAIIQLRALPGLSIHLAPSGAHPSGRLLHCIVVWGGHRLSLVNTYWPIGHSAKRNYRDQVLLPHLPHCLRASLLLVGDFNNVPDAAADRMPTAGSNRQLTLGRRSEERVAAELVAALTHADAPVADVYRHFYPAAVKPGFTHGVEPTRPHALTAYTQLPTCCHPCLALTQQRQTVSATMWLSPSRLCRAPHAPLRSTRGAQTWPSCPTQT
jgi:hypothetical protein